MPARVRARVSEIAVLGVSAVEDGVAVWAGADVEGRVGLVVRVDLRVEARPERVGREDPVGGEWLFVAFVVGGGRRQVGAPPGSDFRFAAAVAAVEPDLIAATAAAGEEVAGGQVLDADAIGLEHVEAVAPGWLAFGVERPEVLVAGDRTALRCFGLGPVEHHPVAVHAADIEPGLLDA